MLMATQVPLQVPHQVINHWRRANVVPSVAQISPHCSHTVFRTPLEVGRLTWLETETNFVELVNGVADGKQSS